MKVIMNILKQSLTILSAIVLLITSSNVLAAEKEGKFFGAKQTEYPSWFKDSFLNFQEDLEEANAAGKRIMLLFHQDGCPYCNALVERNLAQKDIEAKVRKNFDVISINMWGDRELTFLDGKQYIEKNLAEALRVQFTPTLLFFDEKGKVVLRLNGYRAPHRFSVDLDYVALHKEKEISYRDYVKANLTQKASSKHLHKEDFFLPPPYDLRRKPGSKVLAVFFEQKDCPNCDTLHEKVLPDKQLRSVIKNADAVQLDMWSKTELVTPQGKKTTAREWAKELDIKFAPSIVLFNQKGKEVIRSEAFFKVFHTQGIFQYAISGGYLKQPSFQRWLSEYADQYREQGKDVDIWRYSNEKPGDEKAGSHTKK
jgi:thioredoxin-related protein